MAETPRTPPKGVLPYMTVRDAAAAIDFYVKGLGATEVTRMPADDGRRIMHAEMSLNGGTFYFCDDFPEFRGGTPNTPEAGGRTPVMMHLNVADVDAHMERAVAAGATVDMPAQDMFWGERYGRVRDPFGHLWAFDGPVTGK